MERLLDYVLYALLGHDYKVKYVGKRYVGRHTWLLTFEEDVMIYLDERDIPVIQFIAEYQVEDQESKDRYNHLLEQLTINK